MHAAREGTKAAELNRFRTFWKSQEANVPDARLLRKGSHRGWNCRQPKG
jgi:hypothetical protein